MRIQVITVAALIMTSLQAAASPGAPTADCTKLMDAYNAAAKIASSEAARTIGDNSAARATLSATKISNEMVARQMNLILMIQWKCPLPTTPVMTDEFPLDAVKCQTELIKGNSHAPECDTSLWRRPGG